MSSTVLSKRDILTFEDFKNHNGIVYWWASEVGLMLGYPDIHSFEKVLNRVTKACISLNIPNYENIIAQKRVVDGVEVQDFKLTRFACYLAAMNGDTKKPEVAAAQVYFVAQTRKFELYVQDAQDIDRLLIRDDIAESNKSLASVVKNAQVISYAKFQNAGYLGLYNMPSWKLEKKRGISKGKSLFDSMGRTELAANLFRITQTEEAIKKNHITGQTNLEQIHHDVGAKVRSIVQQNTGVNPEDLPQSVGLPAVKKTLKSGYHKMVEEDK